MADNSFWTKDGKLLVDGAGKAYYDDHCCCEEELLDSDLKKFATFIDINNDVNSHVAYPFPQTFIRHENGNVNHTPGQWENVLADGEYDKGVWATTIFFPPYQRFMLDGNDDHWANKKELLIYTTPLKSSNATINVVKLNSYVLKLFIKGTKYGTYYNRINQENVELDVAVTQLNVLLTSLILNNSDYSVENEASFWINFSQISPPYDTMVLKNIEIDGTTYTLGKDGNTNGIIMSGGHLCYNNGTDWVIYEDPSTGYRGDEFIMTDRNYNFSGDDDYYVIDSGSDYDKVYAEPIQFLKDIFVKRIMTGTTSAYLYSQDNPVEVMNKGYNRFPTSTSLGPQLTLSENQTVYFYLKDINKSNGYTLWTLHELYYCLLSGETFYYFCNETLDYDGQVTKRLDTEHYPFSKIIPIEGNMVIRGTIRRDINILPDNPYYTGYWIELYPYISQNQFYTENYTLAEFDSEANRFYFMSGGNKCYFGDDGVEQKLSGLFLGGDEVEIDVSYGGDIFPTYTYTCYYHGKYYNLFPKYYIYKRVSQPANLIEQINNNNWIVRDSNLDISDYETGYVLHKGGYFYKILPSANAWYFYEDGYGSQKQLNLLCATAAQGLVPPYWFNEGSDSVHNIFSTYYKPWYTAELTKKDTNLYLKNGYTWYVYYYDMGQMIEPNCISLPHVWAPQLGSVDLQYKDGWSGWNFYYLTSPGEYEGGPVYYFSAYIMGYNENHEIFWLGGVTKAYYYYDENGDKQYLYAGKTFVDEPVDRYFITAYDYDGEQELYDATDVVTGDFNEHIDIYLTIPTDYDDYELVYYDKEPDYQPDREFYTRTLLRRTGTSTVGNDTIYDYGGISFRIINDGEGGYTFGGVNITTIVDRGYGIFTYNNIQHVYVWENSLHTFYIKNSLDTTNNPVIVRKYYKGTDINDIFTDPTASFMADICIHYPDSSLRLTEIVKISNNYYPVKTATENQLRTDLFYYKNPDTYKFDLMHYDETEQVLKCEMRVYLPYIEYNYNQYFWKEGKGYGYIWPDNVSERVEAGQYISGVAPNYYHDFFLKISDPQHGINGFIQVFEEHNWSEFFYVVEENGVLVQVDVTDLVYSGEPLHLWVRGQYGDELNEYKIIAWDSVTHKFYEAGDEILVQKYLELIEMTGGYDPELKVLYTNYPIEVTGSIVTWSDSVKEASYDDYNSKVFLVKSIYYDKAYGLVINELDVYSDKEFESLKNEDKKMLNTSIGLQSINPLVLLHTWTRHTDFLSYKYNEDDVPDLHSAITLLWNIQSAVTYFKNDVDCVDHWKNEEVHTFYDRSHNTTNFEHSNPTQSYWSDSNTDFVYVLQNPNTEFNNLIVELRRVPDERYEIKYDSEKDIFYTPLSDPKFNHYWINDVFSATPNHTQGTECEMSFNPYLRQYYAWYTKDDKVYALTLDDLHYVTNDKGLLMFPSEDNKVFCTSGRIVYGDKYDFLTYYNGEVVQYNPTSKRIYDRNGYYMLDNEDNYITIEHLNINLESSWFSLFDLTNYQKHFEDIADIDALCTSVQLLRGMECLILVGTMIDLHSNIQMSNGDLRDSAAPRTKNVRIIQQRKVNLLFNRPYHIGLRKESIPNIGTYSDEDVENISYASSYLQTDTTMKRTYEERFYMNPVSTYQDFIQGFYTIVIIRPVRNIGPNDNNSGNNEGEGSGEGNSGSSGSGSGTNEHGGSGPNGEYTWEDIEGANPGDHVIGVNGSNWGPETPP